MVNLFYRHTHAHARTHAHTHMHSYRYSTKSVVLKIMKDNYIWSHKIPNDTQRGIKHINVIKVIRLSQGIVILTGIQRYMGDKSFACSNCEKGSADISGIITHIKTLGRIF